MEKGKKIVSIVCMVLFLVSVLPVLSGQQTTNEASGIYTRQFVVEFSPHNIIFSHANGYDLLSFDNAMYLNDIGSPMIPSQDVQFALPAGMKATDIKIIDSSSQDLEGRYIVFPMQPPQTTDTMDEKVTELQVNLVTYSSSSSYPGQLVRLLGQSDLYGQGIAHVLISPIQYRPSEQKLTVYTSITIQLIGVGGYLYGDYLPKTVSAADRVTFTQQVQTMVTNPTDVQLQESPETPQTRALPSGGPYQHVIISRANDVSYWQRLADWNTKRGLKDIVVTTTYIYANYAGTSNQQKIRNFVIDAYNTWVTTFFLIAGEQTDVPLQSKSYYINYQNWPVSSDQYYGDFDDDYTCEVHVGRVTARDSSQINLFIDKVFKYEKDPPLTNYATKAALQGMDVTTVGYDGQLTRGESLKITVNNSYIPHPRFTVTTIYDTQTYNPTHKQKFINALNAGQNLVNHYDHSDQTSIGMGDRNHYTYMYSNEVDALTNTNKLCNVFSIGCHPNDFTYEDSISEHFVIYNALKAGVSFTSNVGYGWFMIGNPDSLSGHFDKLWWQALFSYNKYTLGEMLTQAKILYGYPSQDVDKYCSYGLELLGEPAMPVWTDNPSSLTLSHPSTLPIGPSTFTVHVTSGGSPVSSALVCLWKGTEVYLTGTTNANGDVTFTPNPTTTGTMYVTATKQNYLPKETSAEVQQSGNLLVDGHCFYPDMSPVTPASVDLFNLNTGESWTADINGNYYSKLLLPNDDLYVGDTLRIIARDNQESVNVTDHVVTSGEITGGNIHLDLTLRVHYRDLTKFPFYLSTINTGAMVMKMMMDYVMWNSTTHPNGPPSVYSEQTLYNTYAGGNYMNGDELWQGLNTEIDDHGHGWIYGYFFNPAYNTSVTPILKSICVWLDYPVDYYNDIRDVDVPKPGHPNHVPIAVPLDGNYNHWAVIRGIHTDKNAWLPPSQLTVYGFWLNDPKSGGLGTNTYVTSSRFVSTYFLPLNVPGDIYNGKYFAVTDPYPGATLDTSTVDITLAQPDGGLSVPEQLLVMSAGRMQSLKQPAHNVIVNAAFTQTMNVLIYGDQQVASAFAASHLLGKPLLQDNMWTVCFGTTDTTFTVHLDSHASLLEFFIQ